MGTKQTLDPAICTAQLADTKLDPDTRFEATTSLGASGDRNVVPHLRQALSDQQWKVRWGAARALGQVRATEAVPDLLLCLLADPDETVRQGAEEALAEIVATAISHGAGAKEHLDDLITKAICARLTDSKLDPQVRFEAAFFLRRRDHDKVCMHLRQALSDPEWKVRWGASLALGELLGSEIWGTEAIPDLVHLLEDPHEKVRQGAERSLLRLAALFAVKVKQGGERFLAKLAASEHYAIQSLAKTQRAKLNPLARLIDRLLRISERRVASQVRRLDQSREPTNCLLCAACGHKQSPDAWDERSGT